MPTVAQIRAAIVAEMQAVTDIGAVHDYQRYATNNADMAALYRVEMGTPPAAPLSPRNPPRSAPSHPRSTRASSPRWRRRGIANCWSA